MHLIKKLLLVSILLIFSCKDNTKKNPPVKTKAVALKEIKKPKSNENFILNDKNAIPFFYEYEKKIKKIW